MKSFEIDERLQADSYYLGDFELSTLLMAKDANYPWFILVPRRSGVKEIYQLESTDQQQLLAESNALSTLIMDYFEGHKLNVAALGNMVPQLHVHHVVRYPDDAAWPGPIWGAVPAKIYSPKTLEKITKDIMVRLEKKGFNRNSSL